jgi:hypothetical protein
MRTLKAFGMTLLVAVLVAGMAVAVSAKPTTGSSSVSVNASFEISSWISLAIVGNGDVSFANIAGPGTYDGSNETELRVMSTTNWTISDSILWSKSTLPAGASQDTLASALVRTYDLTSGTWGVHDVNVSYQFTLDADDLVTLPEGEYNLVVQYTATTD